MANQNDENEEIEIQHRILIEEEEIEISELPEEIRNSMREFNKKLKTYEASGDADLFFKIQQDDVVIANNILTFLEDEEAEGEEEEEEEEEEEDDKKKTSNSAPTKTAPVVNTTPAPVVDTPPAPVVNTPPVVAPVATAEEQVKTSMKEGIISVSDLERILNREPNYPIEQVGSIKLRKQYLRPFYELSK